MRSCCVLQKDTPGINYNHVILEKPVRGRYGSRDSSAEGYAVLLKMYLEGARGKKLNPIDSWGDAPGYRYFCPSGLHNEPLSYFISSKPGASVTVDFGKAVTYRQFCICSVTMITCQQIGIVMNSSIGERAVGTLWLGEEMAENLFCHKDGANTWGAWSYLHDSTLWRRRNDISYGRWCYNTD